MSEFIGHAIADSYQRFLDGIVRFLPNLLTAILILVIGIVVSGLLRFVLARVFRWIRVDRIASRLGVPNLLQRGGITEPVSSLCARVLSWITGIGFAILALYALDVPTVERLLERFLLYIPNLFVAALILYFGYIVGHFAARAALIAAVNAGSRISGLIARFVRATIFILTLSMSLEQLGIGSETVIIAFAIVFGGIVMALAIAFGLGGRDIARSYLSKRIRGEDDDRDGDIHHV